MSSGLLLPIALPPVVMVALCAATARAIGGDPMLGAELGLASIIGVWLMLLVRRIRSAIVSQRLLEGAATPIRLGHRVVQLLDSRPAAEAFVAGPLQPSVFVSRALLDMLDADELQAVLLHEEHHQRTRAPLRGLALACWSRLVGGVPAIGRSIERRVAHLEVEADRCAVAAGASAAAIASALIKCDRSASPSGVGFASVADLRLRRLIGGDEGTIGPAAAPIEWLAPALIALGLGVCHLFLG